MNFNKQQRWAWMLTHCSRGYLSSRRESMSRLMQAKINIGSENISKISPTDGETGSSKATDFSKDK